jgi:hypothetical protein
MGASGRSFVTASAPPSDMTAGPASISSLGDANALSDAVFAVLALLGSAALSHVTDLGGFGAR